MVITIKQATIAAATADLILAALAARGYVGRVRRSYEVKQLQEAQTVEQKIDAVRSELQQQSYLELNNAIQQHYAVQQATNEKHNEELAKIAAEKEALQKAYSDLHSSFYSYSADNHSVYESTLRFLADFATTHVDGIVSLKIGDYSYFRSSNLADKVHAAQAVEAYLAFNYHDQTKTLDHPADIFTDLEMREYIKEFSEGKKASLTLNEYWMAKLEKDLEEKYYQFLVDNEADLCHKNLPRFDWDVQVDERPTDSQIREAALNAIMRFFDEDESRLTKTYCDSLIISVINNILALQQHGLDNSLTPDPDNGAPVPQYIPPPSIDWDVFSIALQRFSARQEPEQNLFERSTPSVTHAAYEYVRNELASNTGAPYSADRYAWSSTLTYACRYFTWG